ncbi:MAG: tetratricopeptide repeat protein [Proteobacteria bacterium]|nr:tetratricopeptide repeat protein [Pseudomonadota bacterium]
MILTKRKFSWKLILISVLAFMSLSPIVMKHSVIAAEQQNKEYNEGISAAIKSNFEDARNRFIKAVKLDIESNDDDTFSSLGLTVAEDVLNKKITKDVGKTLCQALQFLPYKGLTKEMNNMFFNVGIENSRRAIGLDLNYAVAYMILGYSYALKGDIGSAIDALNKATNIDPNFATAHALLSALYRSQNKHELSDKHLNRAAQLVNQGVQVPNSLLQRFKKMGLLSAAKKGDLRYYVFQPENVEAQWITIEKLQKLLREHRYDLIPDCFSSGEYRVV